MNLFKMLQATFTSAPRCTPTECAHRVRNGEAFLVDVREPGEWADGVAQSARLLSFSDLTGARAQWTQFLADAGGREVLLYCASGSRSGFAARLLVAEGVRAANTGGLADWLDAGWPVVPPLISLSDLIPQPQKNTHMKTNVGSIDRTVRIIAGLALLGAGYYFKSWWGLIGFGPLLTGIIRFCPAYLPFGLSTCPAKPDDKA